MSRDASSSSGEPATLRVPERFAQHEAEAVPIARLARRAACLLRRHVRGRALGGAAPLVARVVHEPEVEQHHTAPRLHEHVRRFDIAMQLAGGVQRAHPFAELQQRGAQARFVRTRRRPTSRCARG